MLSISPAFVVRRVVLDGPAVVLEAEGTAREARCPTCGVPSGRVHDRYRRRPSDLPWRGRVVRLVVTVRRFRCDARGCPRATFAERFDPAVARGTRRTADATAFLLALARAAGGEGGARLAVAAGLPVSADTLLRLLRRAHGAAAPTPRVLGVDDLSLRRGRSYATLLVDLERRAPVDLVPGREAATLRDWLRAHPGVEVVVRDRSGAYAEGAAVGAPDAAQVADRFHLVLNASAALDEVLRGRTRRLQVQASRAEAMPGPAPARPPPPPTPSEQRRVERRERRVARWEEVRARRAAGETVAGIARSVGLDRKTIRRWLRYAAAPPRGRPPRPPDVPSPSLRPYLAYLQDRWQAGCTNISQLYREIAALGYTRSRSLVAQALLPWRGPRPPAAPDGTRRRGRPRVRRFKVRWLCLRPPEQLDPEERAALERVLAEEDDVAAGHDLLQRFRRLVAARDPAALDGWLVDAVASGLGPFVSLAAGIALDRAAVDAALLTPWSNGPVEGLVHKVKLLKRQGYGRAKLDLLRARVLAA